MTYAKNLGPWKFNLNNKFIWKATDALKKLLPKFRYLNTYLKTNDHLGVQENVITDLNFRPIVHTPERMRRVFKGINRPIVISSSPALSEGQYGYNQNWLQARNSIIIPFSIVKGVLKRDFLTLDSTLSQIEESFSFKRDNYLSLVDSINNLLTYYSDNGNQDYAEAITFFQNRADYLNQSLITLANMRAEIAQNLIDIDAYQESDLDLENRYYAHYRQIRDSLTYNNFDNYLTSQTLLNQLSNLFRIPFTTYVDGFYPLRTDGSIDYQSNNIPFTSSEKRLYDVRYLGMGSIYQEEFVDPKLHVKGTPLNEDTTSIRNVTNGPVLATRIGKQFGRDYVVDSKLSYNSFYVNDETINDYSDKLFFKGNFGNNQFETYDYNLIYFENRLHRGILYPNQGAINPPHILSHELNYEVRPRILLCFDESHENNTIFVGANMLSRKSIEVDHVYHSPHGTFNYGYNFEEPWKEIPFKYANDEYTIKINHLSPKETFNAIAGQDDQFEVRHNELFFFRTANLGTRSTLIGNKLSEDYRTSDYLHHVELEERLHRPVINTLLVENSANPLSNYSWHPYYQDYISEDYAGGSYLHEHGRYHPNRGLYNVEDLFVSASHLGDRYNKEKWNTYDEELDKEEPLVIYRRGYLVTDHINLSLDYGNDSSVVQYGNPGDYWGHTVITTDFDEDTWDITNVYNSTYQIIWHGRNPDVPVEEPFLWLYKGQHRRKLVRLHESYRADGTLSYRSFEHRESVQNIYFYHKGYVVGPHTERTGSFTSDFTDQVDSLNMYGGYSYFDTWNTGYGVETLYAKNESEYVYYDSNGNETYRNTSNAYEDTFDETPVEDIVDRIKAGNNFPPIWGDQGDGFDHSYSNNPFGNKFFDGHNYPWTDDYYDKGIKVEGTSSNLHLYFLDKNDTKYTVCNINFEIDSPLSE